MTERHEGKARGGVFAREDRRLLIAVVGVLLVAFALVASNVAANHAPKPHHVPLGIIGAPPAVRAVTGQLGQRAPGGYRIFTVHALRARGKPPTVTA